MKLVLKIAAGIILAFVLLAAACTALVSEGVKQASQPSAKNNSPAEPQAGGEFDGESAGQRNARGQAQNYLDTAAFSRKSLIQQLKFEGFSHAEAVYAVDAVSPDWNEQAVKQAMNYLETASFSRSGLLQQLRFEGFTPAQAQYGVDRAYR